MKARDLSGMTFGSLYVCQFDAERYAADKELFEAGCISRVRRHYICTCLICGRKISVRGENLVSGNTTGCGCDSYSKGAEKRHKASLNEYNYNDMMHCVVGKSNNTESVFYFDEADFELIQNHCWYETNHGYMMTKLKDGKQILMHRLLLLGESYEDSGVCIDHINRNKLDNRRSNLRVCSSQENSWNTGVHSNSKSGERGVRWHDKTGMWNAYITLSGKFKSLGYYKDIESAIVARRSAEKKYRGEFAPQ